MIEPLQEITLGSEALDYIRESLSDGKALSKCLRSTLDLRSGRVRTYLPAGTTTTAINQFSVGGKLRSRTEEVSASTRKGEIPNAVPIPNTDSMLISKVRTHLESGHSAFCLFANALARPDDPWLSQSKVRTLVCGIDVYHFLTPDNKNSDFIRLTIKKARSIGPPLLGAFASSSPAASSLESGAVELAELQKVAEQTEKLVVGAYDGEGFLIWSR